ncbi:MAG: DNA repair protein RadC [Acidobacteria bacterium]|nr:MAG: DNA repair protein RadC [Acidobacteriota bacterium]
MMGMTALKRLPAEQRPRERLLRSGGAALSDAELLAVLLRTGRPGLSAVELANELLASCGGLTGLLDARGERLRRRGLGQAKAAAVLAAVELGRRLARAQLPERQLLDQPAALARYLALRYDVRDQEVMGALYLDVRNSLIGERDLYRGTLSRTAVEPRAILKEGLLRGASGFVLFHTHPSGDPTPSAEDLAFTRRMAEAGKIVGVPLLDHLILGGGGRFVSLNRRGGW